LISWSVGLFIEGPSDRQTNKLLESNPGGYPSGQRGLTVNQLAEAFGGSNPSPPTPGMRRAARLAHVAQSAEHVLGKNGVMGSNPIVGSVAVIFDACIKGVTHGEAEV